MLIDVRVGIVVKIDYGEYLDLDFDFKVFFVVVNIFFDGVYGSLVCYFVWMFGSKEVFIIGIDICNMNVGLIRKKRNVFICDFF